MPMPTIDAMMTPIMTISAVMMRNRMLLKWSSISFRYMVKIPCTSGLLEIFHVDLFEGVGLALLQPQPPLG